MEGLVEILRLVLQWLCELLLQLLFEGLAEFGLESIRELVRPSKRSQPERSGGNPESRQRRDVGQPVLAVFGHALLGALFGLLSLWPFPNSFTHYAWMRIANFIITPVVAGFAMVALGRWRMRRRQGGLYLHRFGYGFLFALTFALVRLALTR